MMMEDECPKLMGDQGCGLTKKASCLRVLNDKECWLMKDDELPVPISNQRGLMDED